MTSPRMVTMSDVAQHAGVSRPTVSHVLNGRTEGVFVSEQTRNRVLEAAQILGYQANGAAKAMKSGNFGSVALLLSNRPNHSTLPAQVLNGIHDELARHDLHLSLFCLPDEQLTDAQQMPKILRQWMADGMIVDYTHDIPSRLFELIEGHKLPVVWFNVDRQWDTVRPDDYEAGRRAARHLLEQGHTRIAFLNHSHDRRFLEGAEAPEHYSGRARFRGVADEMALAGLAPILEARRPDDDADIIARESVGRIREMLRREKPTAVVCYSTLNPTLLAARDLGLEVPRDLSLVQFGAPEICFLGLRESVPRPTTGFSPCEYAMGRELVQMLLRKIADPTTKIPARTLAFEFQEGATTAPVSR